MSGDPLESVRIELTNGKELRVKRNFCDLDEMQAESKGRFDLFLWPRFMMLQAGFGLLHAFEYRDCSSGLLTGVGYFIEEPCGKFSSPGRGSFGGLQIEGSANLPDYFQFAEAVDGYLARLKPKTISIVLPPTSYDPVRSALWLNCWSRLDYVTQRVELSYAIEVSSRSFDEFAAYSSRKRIKKCEREKLNVFEVPPAQFNEVYQVIALNRESRGYPMTMSYDALLAAVTKLDPAIHLFAAKSEDGSIVAAAVVYEINSKIDYVFYWGDRPGFEQSSPVTLLARHLYRRAQSKEKSLLDLGISTVNQVPNPGLIRFKENLGATCSTKFYMTKSF